MMKTSREKIQICRCTHGTKIVSKFDSFFLIFPVKPPKNIPELCFSGRCLRKNRGALGAGRRLFICALISSITLHSKKGGSIQGVTILGGPLVKGDLKAIDFPTFSATPALR